jgi:hypothetical protein
MHEIHCSFCAFVLFVFPSMYQYVTVRTEYIPSTKPVQTWYIVVHTCKSFGIPSTSEYVLSWLIAISVHTILYCVLSYHLVLLCSCTYLFVMHLTILRISTFQFGTWYIQICTVISAVQICTVISAVQIWMCQVPN